MIGNSLFSDVETTIKKHTDAQLKIYQKNLSQQRSKFEPNSSMHSVKQGWNNYNPAELSSVQTSDRPTQPTISVMGSHPHTQLISQQMFGSKHSKSSYLPRDIRQTSTMTKTQISMVKQNLKKRYDCKNMTSVKMIPPINRDILNEVKDMGRSQTQKVAKTYEHLLQLFNQQKEQILLLQKTT